MLPGGSEADWGPADVNPGPRPATGGGGTTGGGTGGGAPSGGTGGGTPGGSAPLAFTLKAPAGKLRVTGRVLKVKIGCACTFSAKLTLEGRTVARKNGSLQKAGSIVAIKLSAKQARALRKLRRGSNALRLTVSARSGARSATRSVAVAPR